MIFKDAVRTAQETQSVSVIKTDQLMLYMERLCSVSDRFLLPESYLYYCHRESQAIDPGSYQPTFRRNLIHDASAESECIRCKWLQKWTRVYTSIILSSRMPGYINMKCSMAGFSRPRTVSVRLTSCSYLYLCFCCRGSGDGERKTHQS